MRLRGAAAIKAGDLQQALDDFFAAQRLEFDAPTLVDIGDCYRQLDEPQTALAYYRQFRPLAADRAQLFAVDARIGELDPPHITFAARPRGSEPKWMESDALVRAATAAGQPVLGDPPIELPADVSGPLAMAEWPAAPGPPSSVLLDPGNTAPAGKPWYRRGWLWVAAAIVAGAAAGTVATAALLGGRRSEPGTDLGTYQGLPR